MQLKKDKRVSKGAKQKMKSLKALQEYTHTHTDSLKVIKINRNIDIKAMCFSES